MMLFTDQGRCYWLKVHEIPEGSRTSRGKSIVNLIQKEPNETIAAYVAVKDFSAPLNVLMVTEQGMIKKTALEEFSNPRKTGIGAIGLDKKDKLMDVHLTDGKQDVVIGTREGVAIRFHEQEVRVMGRSAGGVRAIKLEKGDAVVGAVVLRRTGATILVATENGFGKRSEVEDYRTSHRGGKGIITMKTTEKTGKMIAIKEVVDKDDVVIVTANGIIIRQHALDIRVAGRNTQGVRLIKLGEGDTVADVAAVPAEEEEPTNGAPMKPDESKEEKTEEGQQSLFDEDAGEKKRLKATNEKKTPSDEGGEAVVKADGKRERPKAEAGKGRSAERATGRAKAAVTKPASRKTGEKTAGKKGRKQHSKAKREKKSPRKR
jgi:DNA gyrase subunit A